MRSRLRHLQQLGTQYNRGMATGQLALVRQRHALDIERMFVYNDIILLVGDTIWLLLRIGCDQSKEGHGHRFGI